MKSDFDNTWPKVVKIAGLAIAIWETVVDKTDRPSLLILAAGMMGLDYVRRAASSSGSRRDSEKNKTPNGKS